MSLSAFTRPIHAKAVTAQGLMIDLFAPDFSGLTVQGLATQLSRINRWTGAPHSPYSVAQHSVLVAMEASRRGGPHAGLLALFHDAHEIATGDIPYAVECWLSAACPDALDGLKRDLDAALYQALNLPLIYCAKSDTEIVAAAHDIVVAAEMRDLFSHDAYTDVLLRAMNATHEPLKHVFIRPLAPYKAEEFFLRTHAALMAELLAAGPRVSDKVPA